jgi:hypothetical protein
VVSGVKSERAMRPATAREATAIKVAGVARERRTHGDDGRRMRRFWLQGACVDNLE